MQRKTTAWVSLLFSSALFLSKTNVYHLLFGGQLEFLHCSRVKCAVEKTNTYSGWFLASSDKTHREKGAASFFKERGCSHTLCEHKNTLKIIKKWKTWKNHKSPRRQSNLWRKKKQENNIPLKINVWKRSNSLCTKFTGNNFFSWFSLFREGKQKIAKTHKTDCAIEQEKSVFFGWKRIFLLSFTESADLSW